MVRMPQGAQTGPTRPCMAVQGMQAPDRPRQALYGRTGHGGCSGICSAECGIEGAKNNFWANGALFYKGSSI